MDTYAIKPLDLEEKDNILADLKADLEEDVTGSDVAPKRLDGTERKLTSTGALDNRGGKKEGAGRQPIEKRLSNYNMAISLLDEHIIDALNVLIDGLESDDKWYRKSCAESLLKKCIADKKKNEIPVSDTKSITLEKVDIKNAVEDVDRILQKRIKDRVILDVEFKPESVSK